MQATIQVGCEREQASPVLLKECIYSIYVVSMRLQLGNTSGIIYI